MWLYLSLLAISVVVPLILSFDKRLQFYKQWKYLFPAIALVAIFYIICDIWLTYKGVWGFNSRYHLPYRFWGLPIEEWLFFVVIPYACIFLHDAIKLYFPQFKLSQATTKWLTVVAIALTLIVAIVYYIRTYTIYIFLTLVVALLLSFFDRNKELRYFYITFFVMLIPFVIVNGVLTGSFIQEEVVWYNNNENLNIRFFTIPAEDFIYAFTLVYLNLWIRNRIKQIY